MSTQSTDLNDLRDTVREKYGNAALAVSEGATAVSCCESSCCGGNAKDPITSDLFSDAEAAEIPETALQASLGCGNPTALAELNPGETVLDLGSGGGIDVLLSAKRVGPTGHAYGLDMTDEMLALAAKNKAESGLSNVTFLKGHIEDIPLPNNSVDVIISNCVVNLSGDKDQVLREAYRVLKPGGRFAISDVVVEGEMPESIRKDMELFVGCVAGALEYHDYLDRLAIAGFVDATIEPTRRYEFSKIEGAWAPKGVAHLTEEEKRGLDNRIMGAFIRAVKPR